MVRESATRTKSITVWPAPMRRGTSRNSGVALPTTIGLRVLEDLVDRSHHQPRDVRDLVQDVVAVRADAAGEVHVLVVDREIVALADQPLDELDHRALAQVVGAGLEAEAEDADLRCCRLSITACTPRSICRSLLGSIGVEDRQLHVERLRLVEQRPHVLRQARAAERKAGLQVVRREVELRGPGRRSPSPRARRCRAPCRWCRSRWRSRP